MPDLVLRDLITEDVRKANAIKAQEDEKTEAQIKEMIKMQQTGTLIAPSLVTGIMEVNKRVKSATGTVVEVDVKKEAEDDRLGMKDGEERGDVNEAKRRKRA